MIDSISISINSIKYLCHLLHTTCADDNEVKQAVYTFVENTKSFLVHLLKGGLELGENREELLLLIKPMGIENSKPFQFLYGYQSIMKQCTDSSYLIQFITCFITLVASLPKDYQPSWIDNYQDISMEWCSHEKPFSDLRILFQHHIYSAIHTYLPPFSKLQVFLDFDGTLTDKDTCSVGIRGNSLFGTDSLDRQALYCELLEAYNTTFDHQFKAALKKTTIESFCEEYDRIDYDCLQPVIDAGLFKGLEKHKVGITGRLIDLSTNVAFFLKHQNPNSLFVISQSWYNEMIQMCLCNNPFEGNLHIIPSHIHSSSLIYDEHAIATGNLNKRCGGCNHKRDVMSGLVETDSFSIVIGDSLGDLGMLLQARLPILLHPSQRTQQVLHHYKINTPSIMTYQQPLENTIFVAKDWSEIIAVLCQHTMRSDSLQPIIEEQPIEICTKKDCELMSLTNDYYNTVGGDLLKAAIIETIEGGATMIQIRDKTENFDRMIEQANDLKSIVKQYKVPLVINDRVDVAIMSDVDGVHIGQNDMKADLCRRLLGPYKIMGLSAQTVEQAKKAERDGANYIGTGAIFPTISKDDADAVGLDGLKKVCDAVTIPVVSIGGVNKDNTVSTLEAGACGIAVISAIFGREDIREATRELREVIDNALY